MWHFVGYAAGSVALLGLGYWLHFKFGNTVAKDAAILKSVGKQL